MEFNVAQTLCSAIDWWSKNTPHVAALNLGGMRLTYADLRSWTVRIAERLANEGVRPGDRVGICSKNSLEYCALLMAVMRAGAINVPLNARLTVIELGEVIADTDPVVVFCDVDHFQKVGSLGVRVLGLEELSALRKGKDSEFRIELDPDMPVVIISTSGSTARPKGVVFSHRTMINYATGFSMEETSCAAGSRILSAAPLSTSAGFVQLTQYTATGCSLYLESTFDPDHFLQVLAGEKINCFGAVPTFFERIAASSNFDAADLSSIRMATVGGARVSRALQEKWKEKGVVLRQIYGQTEAGGNATIMPADLAEKFPEKCGWGGIFTELAIIDEDGNRCPPGTAGQIIVRGPGMMVGYWRNPEATAQTVRDGWLYTGDLGVLDEDGLLTFVDRLKDLIISGGLNVSAAEVERAVSEYDGVEEVVVIAAPDPKFGETSMAIVYAAKAIDINALVSHCNERLADYKVPRYVVVEREPLPRLATGKLSKPALRQKYKEQFASLPRVR